MGENGVPVASMKCGPHKREALDVLRRLLDMCRRGIGFGIDHAGEETNLDPA